MEEVTKKVRAAYGIDDKQDDEQLELKTDDEKGTKSAAKSSKKVEDSTKQFLTFVRKNLFAFTDFRIGKSFFYQFNIFVFGRSLNLLINKFGNRKKVTFSYLRLLFPCIRATCFSNKH